MYVSFYLNLFQTQDNPNLILYFIHRYRFYSLQLSYTKLSKTILNFKNTKYNVENIFVISIKLSSRTMISCNFFLKFCMFYVKNKGHIYYNNYYHYIIIIIYAHDKLNFIFSITSTFLIIFLMDFQ